MKRVKKYNHQYFQKHTDHYLRIDLTQIPSFAWIKKEVGVQPGEKVLDAGCGTGYLLNFICRQKTKGFGLDLSPQAIKTAKRLFSDQQFVKGDLLNLPFKSGTFDKIICFNVIEHLNEQEKAVEELKRVLKRGGLIVAGTNIKNSLSWWLFKVFLGGDPTHTKEFTAKEFIKFFSRHFEIKKTTQSSCVARFPMPINKLFHWFLKSDILVKARKE